MSLFSGMSVTAGALAAFDSALTVIQNNVSNASTPGYVAQTQTLNAMPFEPGGTDAGGVEAGAVQSARDQFAEQSVRNATSQLGSYQQQASSLSAIQNNFDISGRTGVPAALTNLYSAFTNWAANPTDSSIRQNVITSAQNVASSFQNTAANLSQITSDSNTQISGLVDQVNTLASKIASYNGQILGGSQQDPSVDAAINSTIEQLSQIASVTTIHQPNGTYDVMLSGHTDLVSGIAVDKLNATVYIPTGPVIKSGSVPAVPIQILAGQNDSLNLKIDGTTLPTIQLNAADTTASQVAADIQTQLTAAGSTATATADSQGNISIASGSTGATASVQVLAGSANSTLEFTSNPTPIVKIQNQAGYDVTASASVGGQLGGLLQVRNQVLPSIEGGSSQTGSMNVLAQQFANRVNSLLGTPLFSYDSENATNIAGSLQVNPAVTAQSLPTPQVTSLTGTAVPTPLTITTGSNDTLNLSVNGIAQTPITLNPNDTDLTSVASDLNTQFSSLGIAASASINGNTGALVLSATGTKSSTAIQILPGTANATLGLSATTPTYQSNVNGVALALSNLSNPQNAASQINGQSYTQYFGSIAANVGSQLAAAQDGQTTQTDVVSQAHAMRQQISGVDLNTEAAQVLQFQSAYQAASKVMSVLDTLTQTVIGMIPQGT